MLSPQTEAVGPGPFFDLCLQSRSIYPSFVEEIKELSGLDPQYRDEGSIYLTLDEADEAATRHWASWQSDAGLSIERLTMEAVARIEPSVTGTATGAVFVPGDHQVDNRLLMDAVLIAARRAGAVIVEGKEAGALLMDRGKVAGVVCGGEAFSAGCVIVAAGCWSSSLLETAGLKTSVIPARGQMVAVKGENLPIRSLVHSRKCYLVPRLDGRILIGATLEYTGYRKAVTVGGISALLDAAIELVPELERFEVIETWSGLRPDTPDHLPVLGHAGPENLVLATGHFRNGILLAPVTAQLISDAVVKGRAREELQTFGAGRFESEGARFTERRRS
jgi:glycine oxidase